MNAKKAKAMRRAIKEYGATLPETGHVTIGTGQVIVLPSSQRGMYQIGKKKLHDDRQGKRKA